MEEETYHRKEANRIRHQLQRGSFLHFSKDMPISAYGETLENDLATLCKHPNGYPDGWWKMETDEETTKRLAKDLEHRKRAEEDRIANKYFERALVVIDEMEKCENILLGRSSCTKPCYAGWACPPGYDSSHFRKRCSLLKENFFIWTKSSLPLNLSSACV